MNKRKSPRRPKSRRWQAERRSKRFGYFSKKKYLAVKAKR